MLIDSLGKNQRLQLETIKKKKIQAKFRFNIVSRSNCYLLNISGF